jgi:GGDEF domain-containing protein
MTPADHANTVREALHDAAAGLARLADIDSAIAAVDALQSQAEDNTAAIEAVEAEVRKQERHVDTLLKRAEGAESALVAQAARADAAVQAAEALKAKLDEKWSERDIAMKAAEQARDLLRRLRQWDHLDGAHDGPYWKREIDAALAWNHNG